MSNVLLHSRPRSPVVQSGLKLNQDFVRCVQVLGGRMYSLAPAGSMLGQGSCSVSVEGKAQLNKRAVAEGKKIPNGCWDSTGCRTFTVWRV